MKNAYLKDERLDVSSIKCDWRNYKDALAFGGYDNTQYLVMHFLKPIEQGLEMALIQANKLSGGFLPVGELGLPVPRRMSTARVAPCR